MRFEPTFFFMEKPKAKNSLAPLLQGLMAGGGSWDDGWSPLPVSARVEAMPSCQLRCPSCPTTTGAIRPAIAPGALNPRAFEDFLKDAPHLRTVDLSNYGEVFLNKDLGRILEIAYERGVTISISGTNLNHLAPGMAELLVRTGVSKVRCSIDGATPSTYAKYRVRGDLARVLANIDAINEAKELLRRRNPKLIWQFIVFGHNEHEIAQAREMATARGMAFATKISWDDKISPIRNAARVRQETGMPGTRAGWRAENGHAYLRSLCHQLWNDPQFNADGTNLGCCRNFWGDFGGNVFRDGFAATFNHDKMKRARRTLLGKLEPAPDLPCATCDLYLEMKRSGAYLTRREIEKGR